MLGLNFMPLQNELEISGKIDALRTELVATRRTLDEVVKACAERMSDTLDEVVKACAERMSDTLDEENAAKLAREKRRLDWLRCGIKFMHVEGCRGLPDMWTVYDKHWLQPLGVGRTLREAIDAAILSEANVKGEPTAPATSPQGDAS